VIGRRTLFKGLGALLGGTVAAKLGIAPVDPHRLTGGAAKRLHGVAMQVRKMPTSVRMSEELLGDPKVLWSHDPGAPRFDPVDVGTNKDGKRVRAPRWRCPQQATFVGEQEDV
jgi:hypothetical protein